MKNFKALLFLNAFILGAFVPKAFAEDNQFTSHYLVAEKPYENYARRASAEKKLQLREYLNYESREPCQYYRDPPAGFAIRDCKLVHKEPAKGASTTQAMPSRQNEDKMSLNNVLTSYEINFAFDSAQIEPAAGDTLDQVARDIKKYEPREVTLDGHADRAGPADYNMGLSRRRADMVSQALNDRGIANRIMDEEAFGESDPEIPTPDGVALRENRRVEIQFRR